MPIHWTPFVPCRVLKNFPSLNSKLYRQSMHVHGHIGDFVTKYRYLSSLSSCLPSSSFFSFHFFQITSGGRVVVSVLFCLLSFLCPSFLPFPVARFICIKRIYLGISSNCLISLLHLRNSPRYGSSLLAFRFSFL